MYRKLLTAALLAACAAPGAAAEPAAPEAQVSTQAALSKPANGRLLLNIDKNGERSRVGLDYSLRWDFKDLASLRPGPGLLLDGVKALAGWDITKNTRLNYYGFRTNPWQLILSAEDKPAGAGPGAGGVSAAAAGRAKARSRRLRLSLSPLAEDLRVSFTENLDDMILQASAKDPLWQKAGRKGRKAFVRDLLSLGIWDAPLPVIRESKAGLEYISK